MTAEDFKRIVGREPEIDDLERANCSEAGKPQHRQCGTYADGFPRFETRPDEKEG